MGAVATKIEASSAGTWDEFQSEITSFTTTNGLILDVSRSDWSEERRKNDRTIRLEHLVAWFHMFSDINAKNALVAKLEQIVKANKKGYDIITRLRQLSF